MKTESLGAWLAAELPEPEAVMLAALAWEQTEAEPKVPERLQEH